MPAVPVPAGCRHAVSVEAQLVRGAERAHQKGRCVSRARVVSVRQPHVRSVGGQIFALSSSAVLYY